MSQHPGDRCPGTASRPASCSSPARLADPQFHRAVVLVLDHDEDGALGVVLDRPTELRCWTCCRCGATSVPSGAPFAGGPVSTGSALGRGAVPGTAAVHETPRVAARVRRTGLVDLDTPPELLTGALAGLRIYAGYTGWAGASLEAEIEEGAWYVVPAEPADDLVTGPEQLWGECCGDNRGGWHSWRPFPPIRS